MSGKGDDRRPGDSDTFNDNWDRIFGKRKRKKVDTSEVEPYHIKNAKHLKIKDLAYREKIAEEKRKKEQELFDRLDKEIEDEERSKSDNS